eukprot:12964047-Heterocapsa_arctica.AAC.1
MNPVVNSRTEVVFDSLVWEARFPPRALGGPMKGGGLTAWADRLCDGPGVEPPPARGASGA